MARAHLEKEIHCVARDETGLLGRIVLALAQEQIFISHLSAYSSEGKGYLQFLTAEKDVERACKAVSYFIPTVIVRDVLVVEFENKVGTLASVSKILGSNGIRIDYVYGTSGDGFKIVGIFSTDDNKRAADLINKN